MEEEIINETHSSIWNYQASGINWIIKNELWKNENIPVTPEYYKISEGIKLNLITSIASVIEGSLRNYLITKLISIVYKKVQLEKQLEGYYTSQDDESQEIEALDDNFSEPIEFSSDTTKEKIEEKLEIKKIELNNILNLYREELTTNLNKETSFNLFGKQVDLHFKLSENKKLEDDHTIIKIKNLINNSTWNDLIKHFNNFTNVKLKTILKKQDKKLMGDIGKIFQFRNFIAHSNDIKLEFNTDDVNFKANAKELINYSKSKKFLPNSLTNMYFVEVFAPDKLLIHFKQCLDFYLGSELFQEGDDLQRLKNQIWNQ